LATRQRAAFAVRAATLVLLLAGAIAGAPGVARAGPITDPPNDFLPTFLGPHNADLDVREADVTFNGTSFLLHAILNGPVGTTTGGFYVWGFNRGAGTQGFPTIAPGVIFDRVVVLNNDGTGTVPGFGNLPPGSVTISGNEIFGTVPLAALPSTGFAPQNFQFNLWPRSPAIAGNPNGNVADFAPDNSDALVTTTPEPSSLALLGLGGAALAGWRAWRKRRLKLAA
jgi:hypothetical protein